MLDFTNTDILPTEGPASSSQPAADDVLLAMVRGWMQHVGPTTAAALGSTLGLPASEIDKALLRLEASGAVLRGHFEKKDTEQTEWCDRRLLARIHRLTLGRLRKQIESHFGFQVVLARTEVGGYCSHCQSLRARETGW